MKNKVYFLTLAIILACLLVPQVATAQDGDETGNTTEYIVSAEAANLRSGPGTGYDIVGTAYRGDSLQIYDETPETKGWLRIFRPDEEDAYIADFLVERAPMRFYPSEQGLCR